LLLAPLGSVLLAGCGGGDNEDPAALLAGYGETEYKVTYALSVSTQGENQEGTVTFYWKPGVAWRGDLSLDSSRSSLLATGHIGSSCSAEGDCVLTGDAGYSCGAEGAQGRCVQRPVDSLPVPPFMYFLTQPDYFHSFLMTAPGGVEHSKRTIVGRAADCISHALTSAAVPPADESEVQFEFCYARGVPLFGRLRSVSANFGGGEYRLEATSVQDTVADADLQPPYPVEETPEAQ